jgi:magnesium-dependent phosphatase 1
LLRELKKKRNPEEMGDENAKAEAMQIIGAFQVLPRLVVFDLDYTLWPFYWYNPNHNHNHNHNCFFVLLYNLLFSNFFFSSECRSKREMPSLYPHAKGIVHALKEKGIDIAIASRSPTADIANTFLDKLSLKSFFVAQVGYPLLVSFNKEEFRFDEFVNSIGFF